MAKNRIFSNNKSLSKNVYKEPNYKRLAEFGSGDLFDAGDYISEDYVPPKSGTYFNKHDMIELIREMEKIYGDDE